MHNGCITCSSPPLRERLMKKPRFLSPVWPLLSLFDGVGLVKPRPLLIWSPPHFVAYGSVGSRHNLIMMMTAHHDPNIKPSSSFQKDESHHHHLQITAPFFCESWKKKFACQMHICGGEAFHLHLPLQGGGAII